MYNNSSIDSLIKQIINATFEVHRVLGTGFLEKVYQEALAFELRQIGFHVESEHPISVFYKGADIGFYKADLLVEGKIIIECKCIENIILAHILQVKNYLKATGIPHGLIINFKHKSANIASVFPPG